MEYEEIESISKQFEGKKLLHKTGIQFVFGADKIEVYTPFEGKINEIWYEDLPARFNAYTCEEVQELPGEWKDDDIIINENCIII